jgi:hypothetical protein
MNHLFCIFEILGNSKKKCRNSFLNFKGYSFAMIFIKYFLMKNDNTYREIKKFIFKSI